MRVRDLKLLQLSRLNYTQNLIQRPQNTKMEVPIQKAVDRTKTIIGKLKRL